MCMIYMHIYDIHILYMLYNILLYIMRVRYSLLVREGQGRPVIQGF